MLSESCSLAATNAKDGLLLKWLFGIQGSAMAGVTGNFVNTYRKLFQNFCLLKMIKIG